MKVFVCVLLLGFPLALAFSWAFELTPEGLKRESEVEPHESITAHTGRKIVALTIALAVAASLLVFKEHALDELGLAYQRGQTNYLFRVKIDPMLDDLRGNPRFESLVQEIVPASQLKGAARSK